MQRPDPSVLLACALLAPSCTKFASELDELETERSELDSASDGRDWSCVPAANASTSGTGPTPAAPAPDGAPLTYGMSIVDFVTAASVADVRVRACFRPDVNCESPLSEALAPDAGGLVQISARPGFNGYLEVTGTGMLPTLVFFPAPWSAEMLALLQRTPFRLLPAPALQALGGSARVQLDPAGGVIGVYAYDCLGATAAGVRLELDTSAVPYAFVDDLPVANQDVTSEQGLAGFVNVPPGVVVVSGFAEGQRAAVTVESLLVRTGWLSSMSLLPGYSR